NYKMLQESAEWKEALDKEETITLNQAKFNELMKTRKAQIDKFKGLDKFNNGLKFIIHPDEAERIKKDEAFAKKTENWRKNLERDFYLEETVDVLSKIK
ncbi:MAG: carboxy terminal-processing peptidase, partial [Chryseobacterium sp.]|nr:carboxy terminal-processing peptidase [Chryseobacterium sp.]